MVCVEENLLMLAMKAAGADEEATCKSITPRLNGREAWIQAWSLTGQQRISESAEQRLLSKNLDLPSSFEG